jgi:hypothetical protein
MPKKDLVQLRTHQRCQRSALIQKGHASARTIRRAHTRPLADEEPPAATIPAVLHTSAVTVTQRASSIWPQGLRPRRMIGPVRGHAAHWTDVKTPN